MSNTFSAELAASEPVEAIEAFRVNGRAIEGFEGMWMVRCNGLGKVGLGRMLSTQSSMVSPVLDLEVERVIIASEKRFQLCRLPSDMCKCTGSILVRE